MTELSAQIDNGTVIREQEERTVVYFFINLALHGLVSLGLLMLLLYFASRNRKRKNRRGLSFLLPVIAVLIFLFQTITVFIPRVLDSVYVIKSNYQVVTGVVESVEFLNHAVVIDGESYYFNPFLFKPETGDRLTISYTPYAHFAPEMKPAE